MRQVTCGTVPARGRRATVRGVIVSDRFEGLPGAEQRRILDAQDSIGRFMYQRTAAVLVGPPPGAAGCRNNGSSFLLRLQGNLYLGTAWHVVESWQRRTSSGEKVVLQVGDALLVPSARIAWKDKEHDIVFIRLDEREAARIGIAIFEPVCGWPPPKVSVGDFAYMAGYPALQREQPAADAWVFRSLGFRLRVQSVGDYHVACQFEREYWVATEDRVIPPEGFDPGGMSGGPVILEGRLAYPLVGLVSQHNSAYELVPISTFSHAASGFEDKEPENERQVPP
jgi:hypothetical protein